MFLNGREILLLERCYSYTGAFAEPGIVNNCYWYVKMIIDIESQYVTMLILMIAA